MNFTKKICICRDTFLHSFLDANYIANILKLFVGVAHSKLMQLTLHKIISLSFKAKKNKVCSRKHGRKRRTK